MSFRFTSRTKLLRRGAPLSRWDTRCVSIIVLLIGVLIVVSGCSQAGDPGEAMLKYLQARVAADSDTIRGLSCAAWEGQAVMQADSFRSMNAELDNVTCTKSVSDNGEDGDATLVTCDGQIVTTYNGENRTWSLGTYRMTQEDGEWKMCGEAP